MKKIFILLLLIANTCFGQVDLNLGLRAYYPFSGNANDVSGNNNNPVFNNATLTADRFGNPNSAYHFNGTNSYMQVPNSPTLNMPNKMSISLWVKPTGYYTGPCYNNMCVMKSNPATLPSNYFIRFADVYNGCTAPSTTEERFTGNTVVAAAPFVQLNQWYSVVWTSDGITERIYVNCVLRSSVPAGGVPYTNVSDLLMGKNVDPAFPYWLDGDLDEVRLYDRALNQDEVNVLGGCAVTTNISNIINDYTAVSELDICTNTLTVEDATNFNTGDTVLLIQMKGAIIDSTNTATFGTITDYKNSGNYEFNYVKSKTGNIIELKNILTRQYDIPVGKVQLIRVPYYNSVNVNATLTCPPWDGSKGGVLVLNVRDTVNLNADINVSGNGFKGSQPITNIPPATLYNQTDYAYPANIVDGSRKGEGIAEVSENLIFCRGPLASGGGGANSHNAGGGGGGNGGAGGRGGNEWEGSTIVLTNGGIGGKNYAYSGTNNKIFMGGAGGAGHANEGSGTVGGNGGGIAIINTNTLIPNSFKIISNGLHGPDCINIITCADGVGGGGAGGTIVINTQTIASNFQVQTNGGKGADNNINGPNATGPGGGGGGGSLLVNSGTLLGNITYSATGGVAGRALNQGNTNWGALAGSNGISSPNFIIPVSAIPFQKNIDSVQIKDSLLICNSFDFEGLAYINTNPISTWQWYFGDGGTANTQNTTHTYTTGGIYTVKLIVTDINGCKDSISKNITLIPFTADAGNDTTVCSGSPASVILHASAGSTYAWTSAVFLNDPALQNPVATITATTRFYVAITNTQGCTAIDSVTVTLATAPANTRYPEVTALTYQAVQLQARNLGGNSYIWLPAAGLNNNLIINPVFSHNQSQEYTIKITTAAGCPVVDTVLVTIKGTKGIYVPKAFSPNGDGTNDRLYPILVGIRQLNYFRVFNRWGNLVFETNSGNPAAGWDGRINGFPQPPETFTWTAEGIDIDGITIKKSGNTFLIR